MLKFLSLFSSLFYLFSPSPSEPPGSQSYDVSPYQLNVSGWGFSQPTVFEVVGEPVDVLQEEEDETMEPKENPLEKLEELYHDPEDFRDRVLTFEETFSQNSYKGTQTDDDPFQYKEGNNAILLSAPHATEQYRDGSVKSADIYTGSMALFLHNLTESHVIYSTYIGEDPNYVEGGAYKEKIKEIVEEKNIDYVIDLHGASSSHPFQVDLGTAGGVSLTEAEVKMMQERFKEHGIVHVTENHTFAAETSGTVTNHTYHQFGIPAVQVEMSKVFRNPRNDIESYYKMMGSLVEIVEELSKKK